VCIVEQRAKRGAELLAALKALVEVTGGNLNLYLFAELLAVPLAGALFGGELGNLGRFTG
jgi:hypothetical protein